MSARRARDIAFWVLVVAAVGAQAIVAFSSLTRTTLWEDEAFNLTVPLNLLHGLGYSSDGTLSGSTITPFDPRISTGPVVLLPIAAILATGIDLVVGSRLVPLAFYAGLLVALWILGRRIGGRWAALVALTVPIAFNASAPPSPIQGVTDVLGEIPAAALLAWALVALRKRPWLAGLLIGLAIQAKYISFLAVPAFVIALIVREHGMPWMKRLRSLIVPAVLVFAPTVLVEVSALISLGPHGFLEHLRHTRDFLLDGGQPGVHSTVTEKLATLADSWLLPAGLITVIVVVLALLGVWALAIAVRRPDVRRVALAGHGLVPARDQLQLLLVASIGLAAFVGWWATASHTPLWVRHPAPGLLAFVPVAAAFVVLASRVLWAAGPRFVVRAARL